MDDSSTQASRPWTVRSLADHAAHQADVACWRTRNERDPEDVLEAWIAAFAAQLRTWRAALRAEQEERES